MAIHSFFEENVWPAGCVYNVAAVVGGSCEGGADVEHHYDADGQRNVWLQRRRQEVEVSILEYADYARTRVSGSD